MNQENRSHIVGVLTKPSFLISRVWSMLEKVTCGIWHDPFPHSAVGWGNLGRYLGHQLAVFNLKQETEGKKRCLLNYAVPHTEQAYQLDVLFSPADRQVVTTPLPFQWVWSQGAPFCCGMCMVVQAIPKEVQSRNILANTLADTRPSQHLALSFSVCCFSFF